MDSVLQAVIQITTGIIPPSSTRADVVAMLIERANVRGWTLDLDTVEIHEPRPGMKIGIGLATWEESPDADATAGTEPTTLIAGDEIIAAVDTPRGHLRRLGTDGK